MMKIPLKMNNKIFNNIYLCFILIKMEYIEVYKMMNL